MSTDQLLSTVAILRAYATCDAEALEILIKDAPETSYGDVLAFAIMLIEYHHGQAVPYLDQMARGLMGAAHEDIARSN